MPKQYPLILVFLLINLSGAAPLATAYEDKILAVVNNNLITQKDLQDYVRTTFANLKTQNVPQSQIDDIMAELQADGLKKLIEDNLMLSRANEIKMEIPEKAIQQKIESVKAKYPSEEVFNAALMQHGATYGDFRNKVIEQLKIAGIIEHEVRSKIYVKPQEVTNYYNENKHQFSSSEKINVDSIFIGYKKNEARSVAEQKAAEIMERLKAGDDFLAVAKEVTDIPSIGVVERGTLAKDIEKILLSAFR
jgi:peptidyl-prolyl cis-trans isomerase SurA